MATVVTGAAIVQVGRGVDAAAPAFGRSVRKTGAAAVPSTDPAAVAAWLPDPALTGHAAAGASDAGRELAPRRLPAPILAAATVVHVGLVLIDGHAIPAAFLGAHAADAAPAGRRSHTPEQHSASSARRCCTCTSATSGASMAAAPRDRFFSASRRDKTNVRAKSSNRDPSMRRSDLTSRSVTMWKEGQTGWPPAPINTTDQGSGAHHMRSLQPHYASGSTC